MICVSSCSEASCTGPSVSLVGLASFMACIRQLQSARALKQGSAVLPSLAVRSLQSPGAKRSAAARGRAFEKAPSYGPISLATALFACSIAAAAAAAASAGTIPSSSKNNDCPRRCSRNSSRNDARLPSIGTSNQFYALAFKVL